MFALKQFIIHSIRQKQHPKISLQLPFSILGFHVKLLWDNSLKNFRSSLICCLENVFNLPEVLTKRFTVMLLASSLEFIFVTVPYLEFIS